MLSRRHLYPELGITLLEARKGTRIWFDRYVGRDMNAHSRGMPLYELKMEAGNVEKPNISKTKIITSDAGGESDTSDSMGRADVQPGSFINPLLSMIKAHISTIYPTSERDQEIHITAYFGKELFFNIPNECQGDFFTYDDWRSVKRDGDEGMRSSYQHSCNLFEGYGKIERMDLDFMRSNGMRMRHGYDINENSLSVTIYFRDEGDEWKVKLKYDDKEARWKPTKLVRSLRRVILLDIISATGAPDVRFTVKTQKRVPISEKIDNIIKEVQQDKNKESRGSAESSESSADARGEDKYQSGRMRIVNNHDGGNPHFTLEDEKGKRGQRQLTFSIEDFKGKLSVTRIEEILTKQKFSTDTYRLLLCRTLYSAVTGHISQNLNVKMKHYKWVDLKCPQESSTDDDSDDDDADKRRTENLQRKVHALTRSIEDGVMFARVLCKKIAKL
ncbi:5691_t:CDS:2 [Paraglomus brasilianum]|uniref:5691_t:CDS:1 n=1 Tax=Paraglomus brasilianum TaxID=144538 RepID=A0A9N8Z9W8_9GLOM|nr:5691_t:CDS:2 [Paraglomus brasilianum]